MNPLKVNPRRKSSLVAVNEAGRRIGESHPRAKLTDHEVDLIRDLIEDTVDPATGKVVLKGLSYGEVARKFEVSKGTVFDIVRCRRRAQTPAAFRRVEAHDDVAGEPSE